MVLFYLFQIYQHYRYATIEFHSIKFRRVSGERGTEKQIERGDIGFEEEDKRVRRWVVMLYFVVGVFAFEERDARRWRLYRTINICVYVCVVCCNHV